MLDEKRTKDYTKFPKMIALHFMLESTQLFYFN